MPRFLEYISDVQHWLDNYFTKYNGTVYQLKPSAIWTIDEIRIRIDPRTIFAKHLLKGIPYSENSLRRGKIKLAVALAVSSKGEIAPPLIISNDKNISNIKLLLPYKDIGLCYARSGILTEDVFFNNVVPHFIKYLPQNALLVLDGSESHKSKRTEDFLKSEKNISIFMCKAIIIKHYIKEELPYSTL